MAKVFVKFGPVAIEQPEKSGFVRKLSLCSLIVVNVLFPEKILVSFYLYSVTSAGESGVLDPMAWRNVRHIRLPYSH